MNSVIYNIPAELVSEYKGQQVIVRSLVPSAFVRELSEESLDNVQFLQLLSADVDPDALAAFTTWGRDVPLDIVISDPASDFPLLYNFSKLLDKHPVRATIVVKPGFSKAVKLALALRFAVKLDVGQPGPDLVDEMNEILNLYLHGANVSQPVDYFHSMFLSAYRQEPASLWIVQEDDPDLFRFVTDDGVEQVSSRFARSHPAHSVDDQAAEDSRSESRGEPECDSCEFVGPCRGYFKWPDRSYDCTGVKSIFRTIDAAAAELRQNVAGLAATQGGPPS